jgi:2-(1,2-epoxy-1,2-dihydrophenyl)acetyl-CoA isomerase
MGMMQSTDEPEDVLADGPVLLRVNKGVATLTLNRPGASNGMNIDMMRAIHEAVLRVHGNHRVRVVHLRGEGKNFCAGGDVQEFASKGEHLGHFMREVTAHLQAAMGALIRLNAIVVAEVQGYAAGGGGLGLVCASDLVVCADNAKFLAGATRVGMVPDAGATVMLPRIIGFRTAMDVFLTNRTIGADEAQRLGLVNRVVPAASLASETLALCQTLAQGAPAAQAATKRLLWNGVGLSVEDCLPEEARTQAVLAATADAREGLAAVIEKRTPRFTGG